MFDACRDQGAAIMNKVANLPEKMPDLHQIKLSTINGDSNTMMISPRSFDNEEQGGYVEPKKFVPCLIIDSESFITKSYSKSIVRRGSITIDSEN